MATSVATPLERRLGTHRRRQRNHLVEQHRHGARHAAVRPQPQHRRRRARSAGGDQRRARRSAGHAAQQPDLSQGQPGGRAGHHPGADLEDAHAGADLRRGLEHRAAAPVAGRRRRRRRDRRRLAAGGAHRAAAVRPEQATASAPRTCAPRSRRPTPTGPRARSRASGRRLQIYTPDAGAASAQPTTRRLVVAWRNGAAVRLQRRGPGDRRRRGHAHARPLQRRAGDHRPGHAPAGAPTSSRPSTRCAPCCPSCRPQLPADVSCRSPPTAPTRSAPRCTKSRSRW